MDIHLYPISSAPKDGRYILLFGPSGYRTTPLRCEICKFDKAYRPLSPWINHANNSFTDSGSLPTHWAPIPEVCKQIEDNVCSYCGQEYGIGGCDGYCDCVS